VLVEVGNLQGGLGMIWVCREGLGFYFIVSQFQSVFKPSVRECREVLERTGYAEEGLGVYFIVAGSIVYSNRVYASAESFY
jgi:hypothetical protein